jgi:hypothetical protein
MYIHVHTCIYTNIWYIQILVYTDMVYTKHVQTCIYISANVLTCIRTQMKMLHGVQNERFTFEIESENALVGSALEH